MLGYVGDMYSCECHVSLDVSFPMCSPSRLSLLSLTDLVSLSSMLINALLERCFARYVGK